MGSLLFTTANAAALPAFQRRQLTSFRSSGFSGRQFDQGERANRLRGAAMTLINSRARQRATNHPEEGGPQSLPGKVSSKPAV
jgi:hypothetical protein